MPPIPLVRQSLRAMKVAEEEPEGMWTYISAGTCKGSGHHRSVLLLFAGEVVWDPDNDDGQSCSDGNDTGFNLNIDSSFWDKKSVSDNRRSTKALVPNSRQILVFRSRFEIDVRWSWIWVLPNNNDARLGLFRGKHGVGRAMLTFIPLGGRRIFLWVVHFLHVRIPSHLPVYTHRPSRTKVDPLRSSRCERLGSPYAGAASLPQP